MRDFCDFSGNGWLAGGLLLLFGYAFVTSGAGEFIKTVNKPGARQSGTRVSIGAVMTLLAAVRPRIPVTFLGNYWAPLAIGAIFLALGIFITLQTVICGVGLPGLGAVVGGLKYRYWPGVPYLVVAAGIAAAIGMRRKPVAKRVLAAILVACTAFCWVEAAAFHTGVEAERWFAASFVPLIVLGLIEVVGRPKVR